MSDAAGTQEEDVEVIDTIEDDDFTIDVVDDRPDGRDPVPMEELDAQEPALTDDDMRELGSRAKKRISQLTFEKNEARRQLESANREREQALEAARRAIASAKQGEANTVTYQQALLQGQTELASKAVQEAESLLAQANETGDAAEVAKAQKALFQALQNSSRVEEAGRSFASRQQQAARPESNNQTEKPAASPEALQWQEANQDWFWVDKVMTATALGRHEQIIEQGLAKPNTPEYFKLIDDEMRRRFPEKFQGRPGADTGDAGEVSVDTAPQRASETPVAPAGRTSSVKGSPTKVTLTRSEVDLARKLGITPKQYAVEKLKEMQKGN